MKETWSRFLPVLGDMKDASMYARPSKGGVAPVKEVWPLEETVLMKEARPVSLCLWVSVKVWPLSQCLSVLMKEAWLNWRGCSHWKRHYFYQAVSPHKGGVAFIPVRTNTGGVTSTPVKPFKRGMASVPVSINEGGGASGTLPKQTTFTFWVGSLNKLHFYL